MSKENKMKIHIIKASSLIGIVLKERYMISEKINEGSFGCIYQCLDLHKPKHNYVIKISENYKVLGNEIEAL